MINFLLFLSHTTAHKISQKEEVMCKAPNIGFALKLVKTS